MSRCNFVQSRLNQNFLIATEQNQKDIVGSLLLKGADVDSKGLFGRTALHIASQNSHKEIVTILLANSANINITDIFGRTPLYSACEFGTFEVVENLLDRGADANIKANNNTTPLHHATYREEAVALCLLAHGADINAADDHRKNALHWACTNGDYNTARLLLVKGANHDALDEEYNTPNDVAGLHGHGKISALIRRFTTRQRIDKVDVSTQTDLSNAYAIASAVESDNFKGLKSKLVSLTEDIEELEERLKLVELEKLKLAKKRDMLRPRLDVADNFRNLNSNDEMERFKWNGNKDRLTAEWNDVIGQEAKLIEDIRTLALQNKVLKIERVEVFLKMDDLVALKVPDLS